MGLEKGSRGFVQGCEDRRNHGSVPPPPLQAQQDPANPPPRKTGHAILSSRMAPQEAKEVGLGRDDGATPQRPHRYRWAQSSAVRTAVRAAPALLTHRGLTPKDNLLTVRHTTQARAAKEGQKSPKMRTKPGEPSQQTPWGTAGREDKGTAGAKQSRRWEQT